MEVPGDVPHRVDGSPMLLMMMTIIDECMVTSYCANIAGDSELGGEQTQTHACDVLVLWVDGGGTLKLVRCLPC